MTPPCLFVTVVMLSFFKSALGYHGTPGDILKFYSNEIKSQPDGVLVEEMLTWRGNYDELEDNHGVLLCRRVPPASLLTCFLFYVQDTSSGCSPPGRIRSCKPPRARHSVLALHVPFPLARSNCEAPPLTNEDVVAMKGDVVIGDRLIRAYELFLDFCGMLLLDPLTGAPGPTLDSHRMISVTSQEGCWFICAAAF